MIARARTSWFLPSDAILFGALFGVYLTLRAGAAEPWRPFVAHRELAIVNTTALLGVGAAMAMATQFARRREIRRCRGWMLGAVGLAAIFCLITPIEYFDFHELGLFPSKSAHYAAFFVLTGVLLLHVFLGAIVNLRLLVTSTAAWVSEAPAVIRRVEAAARYWYFVDAVWLILFVLLYVA